MFGVKIPFYIIVVRVFPGFVGTICWVSFITLYLYSYIKIPLTWNLNCIQIHVTGNTILLYFSLNFKKKHYIHVEEMITEIFAQKTINAIDVAFMPLMKWSGRLQMTLFILTQYNCWMRPSPNNTILIILFINWWHFGKGKIESILQNLRSNLPENLEKFLPKGVWAASICNCWLYQPKS